MTVLDAEKLPVETAVSRIAFNAAIRSSTLLTENASRVPPEPARAIESSVPVLTARPMTNV